VRYDATMKRDARWFAMVAVVVFAVLGTWGLAADWLTFPAEGIRKFQLPESWAITTASWSWILLDVLAVGIAFAMLAGQRRGYLPQPAALVSAVVGVIATIAVAISLVVICKTTLIEVSWTEATYDGVPWYRMPTAIARFSLAPGAWLTLVASFGFAASSSWLWWIARKASKASAAELSRANRELAKRDGDVVDDNAPDDSMKL
jgi:hypothetical protein